MTESATLPRPRQVTLAAWLIMGGSVLVVASVFEVIAGLNGLETQEGIERFLSEQGGAGLALDVESVLSIIRVLSMVAAGCAAAAAILGYHLLKGNRGARLAITLLAVPLFVSGLVAGGFLSSLVAASAVMLWLEPSRDWFDGKPAKAPPEPERRTPDRPAPPAPPAPPPTPTSPRPHEGFGSTLIGTPTTHAPHLTGGYPPPHTQQHQHQGPPPPPPTRPDSVLWACILTWVFAGIAGLTMAALALVIMASPEVFFDELRRREPQPQDGLSDSEITAAIYVIAGITVVWSSVATVLAILLFNRVSWARLALAVCSAGAGALCLVGATQSLVLVAPFLACAVTFGLLLRREVQAWTAAP